MEKKRAIVHQDRDLQEIISMECSWKFCKPHHNLIMIIVETPETLYLPLPIPAR